MVVVKIQGRSVREVTMYIDDLMSAPHHSTLHVTDRYAQAAPSPATVLACDTQGTLPCADTMSRCSASKRRVHTAPLCSRPGGTGTEDSASVLQLRQLLALPPLA